MHLVPVPVAPFTILQHLSPGCYALSHCPTALGSPCQANRRNPPFSFAISPCFWIVSNASRSCSWPEPPGSQYFTKRTNSSLAKVECGRCAFPIPVAALVLSFDLSNVEHFLATGSRNQDIAATTRFFVALYRVPGVTCQSRDTQTLFDRTANEVDNGNKMASRLLFHECERWFEVQLSTLPWSEVLMCTVTHGNRRIQESSLSVLRK